MIELLRNCSHGSEIATYLVSNLYSEEKIIKVATTPTGVKNLESEVNGWNWYQGVRYPCNIAPLCKATQKRGNYFKIEIEFIQGIKADYRKGLVKNSDSVKKAIEHYCHFWPYYPNALSPLHGDLSIDNIIYNSNGVHIIDWEHFSLSAAPWGFDALYLLFETLWFSMRERKLPTEREINIIGCNLKILNIKNRIDPQKIKYPLRFVINFIKNNSKLWGNQLSVFPNKLPIINFTAEQVSKIDDLIYSNWRK